jgi:hypothetical protein
MLYLAALVLLYAAWIIRYALKVRAFGLRGFLNPFYSPYFWLVACYSYRVASYSRELSIESTRGLLGEPLNYALIYGSGNSNRPVSAFSSCFRAFYN